MNGIFISTDKFGSLSAGAKEEILRVLGIRGTETQPNQDEVDDTEPARFSASEMREFLDGVGGKTRKVLEALAELPARFNIGELLKKLKMEWSDLRAVQAGLTKRTRTISGDRGAYLFRSVVWNDDIRKCVSEMHPSTHEALRKVLNKA